MSDEFKDVNILKNFANHERKNYPNFIVRVTGGYGGEALLILGSEKTALYDCGMAYCADKTLENIKRALKGRSLDYVFLSHTHYDHIGALPNVRKEWPNVVIAGAEHGKKVFERSGARKLMQKLGEVAEITFGQGDVSKITTEGLEVTKVIRDGDIVDLGDKRIRVIEAKGHTDCSLAFGIEPDAVLIASESTGILEREGMVHAAILKSYDDAMNTLKKCREYNAEIIICPHYGVVPHYYNINFWNLFKENAYKEKIFIENLWRKNITIEEILQAYIKRYWVSEREKEQPMEAFIVNAKCIIDVYRPK